MDIDKAVNYINRGIIVTKDVVNKILLLNFGFTIINMLFLIMLDDYINLIISTCISLLNLMYMSILKVIRNTSLKTLFLTYALGLLNFVIIINFIIYGALRSIDAFSLFPFFSLIVLQVLMFITFFIISLKIIANNSKGKKYQAVPFATSGSGYIAYFILKYLVDIPQKYGPILLNFIFYILACLVLYELSKYLIKWYLAKTYDIKAYNNG